MAAKYYSVNDNACFNRHVRLVINLSGDPSLNLHTLDRNSFKVIHEFNSVDTGELLIEEVERFDPGNNAAVWSDKKIYYLVKDNRIEIYTKCFCGTYVYAAWDMLQRLFTYPVSAAMLGCAGVVSLGLGAYYALGACCFSKPFKLWAYVYYRQWKTHIDVEIFLSRDTVENKMLENNNLSFINYKWKRYEILSTKIRTAKYSYKIEYENSDKQKV
jgi:hypothetical protein